MLNVTQKVANDNLKVYFKFKFNLDLHPKLHLKPRSVINK